MKLHCFCSGTITAWKNLLLRGAPENERLTVPVPFYLLEHTKGVFLFDTGQQIPEKEYSFDAPMIPAVSKGERAVELLKARGISPGDLSGIILSHHHRDHTAGLADFPGVPRYIRKEELQYGEWTGQKALDTSPWIYPEGEYDLFNDGQVILLPTPGHTAGHQSLLLTLGSRKKILLAADAAYMTASLEQKPSETEADQPYWKSIRKLKEYARMGVQIIPGHDPEFNTLL